MGKTAKGVFAAHLQDLFLPLLEIRYFVFKHTHAGFPFICSEFEFYGSDMSQPVCSIHTYGLITGKNNIFKAFTSSRTFPGHR